MFNKKAETNLGFLKNYINDINAIDIIQRKPEKEKRDKNCLEKPCKKEKVKPAVLFC
jgi:hypothetical protein